MMNSLRVLLLFVSVVCPLARSADAVLARVPSGAQVTAADIVAEAQQLPPQSRAQLLSRAPEVAKAAQNILVRKELARQAEGLLNDPKVEAALRAARERVLAEAVLARAEGEPPDRATLERLARNQYDAAPAEKYRTPEEIRVRHILIAAKACDADKRAQELLALARQPGADFAALARANSDDPGSAERGGDLGFFSRGKMAAAFEAAAFELKQPGELSDVVKTDFGFHIIRLEERRPAARQPFEAVRDSLVKGLADSGTRTRRQEAIDRITAEVQLNREAIDALAAAGGDPAARPR